MTSITAVSVGLQWTSGGREHVSYEIFLERDTSFGCSDEETTIVSSSLIGGATVIALGRLEEDRRYTFTVTAFNTAGSREVSNTVAGVTAEAGEGERDKGGREREREGEYRDTHRESSIFVFFLA